MVEPERVSGERETPGRRPDRSGARTACDLRPVVLKFGGTSVRDGARIAHVAGLVVARAPQPRIVVVSALAGVTDLLLGLVESASRDGRGEDLERAVANFAERHRVAAREAGIEASRLQELGAAIEAARCSVARSLAGIALLGEATARATDSILASGELLASQIVAAAISARGGDAEWIDPRELIATDDGFGAARPDVERIAEAVSRRALPALAAGRIAVTGGFVGRAPGGATTTLGRGGSDWSAALLGAAAGARAIEIWTDVDGVLTADPRLVPEARALPTISFAEAAELARFGARVLHPATIGPAVERAIPVVVRNTFAPEAAGTTILAETAGEGVRAVSARDGLTALRVSNPRMLLAHGWAARVFAVFERHRVEVDVIATSEVSIATTVDSTAPVEALLRELAGIAHVEAERDLAVVCVVGPHLRGAPRLLAEVFAALGDLPVRMVSHGASTTNLTFVVAAADAADAVRRVHARLLAAPDGSRVGAAALGSVA